jgi:hypothetical protein
VIGKKLQFFSKLPNDFYFFQRWVEVIDFNAWSFRYRIFNFFPLNIVCFKMSWDCCLSSGRSSDISIYQSENVKQLHEKMAMLSDGVRYEYG